MSMKLSQALGAKILHVTPIPNHYLLVLLSIPFRDDEIDHYRLVSLAGIPSVRHLVRNWEVVRKVRIVRRGEALAWPTGDVVMASWLIVSSLSRAISVDEMIALTAPVRRHKRTSMH